MYTVKFTPKAERYFKKIKDKRLKEKFHLALKEIENNPYIGEMKNGDLSGIYGYDVYYNKTNYEISYKIYNEKENIVIIILAGTRENFYEELKKYLK